MKITVMSSFRNASHYITRYFNQMQEFDSLLKAKGHELSLVLGYGDSTDCTDSLLAEESFFRFDTYLVDVNHGGELYGSIIHPQRFKQLSYVGNQLLQHIPKNTDKVFLIESDLVWQGAQLEALLNAQEGLQDALKVPSSRIVLAPMIYHRDGRFYDTWAFRCNGTSFRNNAPYHPVLKSDIRFIEMESVGSVVLLDYDLIKDLRFPEENVVVGFCQQAKEHQARIFLDTQARVFHP